MAKQQVKVKQTDKKDHAPEKMNMQKETFALEKENYILIAIGILIMVIGYIVMAGEENIFSFSNTTLPVIIIMFGFLFVFYAIIKKPKSKTEKNS